MPPSGWTWIHSGRPDEVLGVREGEEVGAAPFAVVAFVSEDTAVVVAAAAAEGAAYDLEPAVGVEVHFASASFDRGGAERIAAAADVADTGAAVG
jgi:hypothetical protein